MADWGSSTESSPSAINNHYQVFPEAALRKMHKKKSEDMNFSSSFFFSWIRNKQGILETRPKKGQGNLKAVGRAQIT